MIKEQNLSVYKTYKNMGLYEYMTVYPFREGCHLEGLTHVPQSESLQKLSSKLHSVK